MSIAPTYFAAALAFAGAVVSAAPDPLQCPPGTVANGEQTPDVDEEWCEIPGAPPVLHGPYRAWWPNGKLGTRGQYTTGKRTGKWIGWYPSGKLQGNEWYVSDKLSRSEYWKESGERTAVLPSKK